MRAQTKDIVSTYLYPINPNVESAQYVKYTRVDKMTALSIFKIQLDYHCEN